MVKKQSEKYSEQQLEEFKKARKKDRVEEEELLKKEDVKQRIRDSRRELNKFLQDRTLQPLSKFKDTCRKEAGAADGYLAKYKYDDEDKNEEPTTFMIKSFMNKTLDKEDKETCFNRYKDSSYKSSIRNFQLFTLPKLKLSDEKKEKRLANYCNQLNTRIEKLKQEINYDDLNISDFIREYVAGDLYRFILYDRAPLVELLNDDLPEEESCDSVKKDDDNVLKNERKTEDNDNKTINGEDRVHILLEQARKKSKVFLKSKFLCNFTTVADLKEKNKSYENAEGFEKILAAQILLGESDGVQPENFGLIEEDGKKVYAKIDHGKSFYCVCSNTNSILKCFLNNLELFKKQYDIKVDLKVLYEKLKNMIKFFSENRDIVNNKIDQKSYILSNLLNPSMEFAICHATECRNKGEFVVSEEKFGYVDGKGFLSSRNDNLTMYYLTGVDNGQPVFLEEKFSYDVENKKFVSDKDNKKVIDYNLKNYFQNMLNRQIKVAFNLTSTLEVITKLGDDKTFTDLIKEYLDSEKEDILVWVIETSRKIEGKDPIAWAVENSKQIKGRDPITWAKENNKLIEGKDSIVWAVEKNRTIEEKEPLVWEAENNRKIEEKEPLVWEAENNRKIEEKDPIVLAIDNNEKIDYKSVINSAKEHNVTFGSRNAEVFLYIDHNKTLNKYLKMEHKLKKHQKSMYAGMLLVIVIGTCITSGIYFGGISMGMTANQQSLYSKVALAVTSVAIIGLVGVIAFMFGISNYSNSRAKCGVETNSGELDNIIKEQQSSKLANESASSVNQSPEDTFEEISNPNTIFQREDDKNLSVTDINTSNSKEC